MRNRAAALALVGLSLSVIGAVCIIGIAGAEAPAAQALDSGMILVDVAALAVLSCLIWPEGRR